VQIQLRWQCGCWHRIAWRLSTPYCTPRPPPSTPPPLPTPVCAHPPCSACPPVQVGICLALIARVALALVADDMLGDSVHEIWRFAAAVSAMELALVMFMAGLSALK